MSQSASSSTLLRRYIGRQFEGLRRRAGMSQEQASKALQRSRQTLIRIEDGDEAVRFRDSDVEAMLRLFNATEGERELLLALTAETRTARKAWWHDYTATALPHWFDLFVTLEDSAETISEYESELIPGLLQTRRYAEVILNLPEGNLPAEEVERQVQVRLQRQSLLSRPRAPHLLTILNEAVLHRVVGDPDVMAEQLEHLVETSRQANVSVRIMPFAAGAHGGMTAASHFWIFDLPVDARTGEQLEPPLVYIDTFTGAMYLNKRDEVAAYRRAWADMEDRALDRDTSRDMIATTLKGLTR